MQRQKWSWTRGIDGRTLKLGPGASTVRPASSTSCIPGVSPQTRTQFLRRPFCYLAILGTATFMKSTGW